MATVNDTTPAEIENQQPAQGVVKRKPVFVKVGDLKPGTNGHTLAVKVLSSTTVLDKKSRNSSSFSGRPGAANTRIAECLIGDETGTILFTARNDQDLYHHARIATDYAPTRFQDPYTIELSILLGARYMNNKGSKSDIPSRVQPQVLGAESIDVSRAEAVAVWNGSIDSTDTQLISTGDLIQAFYISSLITNEDHYFKGFCEGMRKDERGADVTLGFAPADILEAAERTAVALRRTDLAATAAAM
ncbi:hypothetical protein E3N88_19086 [Mikania micrantha]|uniref:Single-stranded DNA binding protein Ssb-like OB fold domain-containing protein n=1 Tax=Mikania micrantha TaxID=192012 RepID=A0A5N6NNU2_9ASTR|nr:hypothetical protein E3N88_19086 [Mikania micrantha]